MPSGEVCSRTWVEVKMVKCSARSWRSREERLVIWSKVEAGFWKIHSMDLGGADFGLALGGVLGGELGGGEIKNMGERFHWDIIAERRGDGWGNNGVRVLNE